MAVKSDRWIIDQCERNRMISPFERAQVRRLDGANGAGAGVISFGVSSYGYDIRLGRAFSAFRGGPDDLLDPKNVDPTLFERVEGVDAFLLPPGRFVLAETTEYFRIPRNIITICFGKSTYARCGVFVNVTPFEPEWEGFATIAIGNAGPSPVKLHAGEGIAQLLFLQSDEVCQVSYQDKKGKYQTQLDITTARV